jgi:hypothetical protein
MDTLVQILGAPMQLMGCFEVHPSTSWVSSQNMNSWFNHASISFYFFGLSLAFLILKKLIWKIMQELIKIKHVKFLKIEIWI